MTYVALSKLEARIMNELDTRSCGMYGLQIALETGIAEGSVYTTLARMAKRGLVESRLVRRDDGPPRRYFTIVRTEEGE